MRLTTPATMRAKTLGSVHGEATRSALAGARAASISTDATLTIGDGARASGGRGSSSRRRSGGG